MKIIRSKERVRLTGEIFTPESLVQEVISHIPDNIINNPNSTVLDPACGDGNFLVEIMKHKISLGMSAIAAAQTIFGVDIMPDNVEACRSRLFRVAFKYVKHNKQEVEQLLDILERNIVCDDALNPKRAWFLKS